MAHNVIAWNNWGSIYTLSQDRGVAETGINIHDNTLIQSGTAWPDYTTPKQQDANGWNQDQGYNGPLFTSNNQGAHNGVWYPNGEDGQQRFSWNGDIARLSDFVKTPGGANDYYLTDAQKDQLLSQAQVPLKPLGPIPAPPPAATATPKVTATVTALPTATAEAGQAVTTNATSAAGNGHRRAGSGANSGLLIVLVLVVLAAGGGAGWYLWRRRRAQVTPADGGDEASLDADHAWGDDRWEGDPWTDDQQADDHWTDEAWTAAREWDEPTGQWQTNPPR